MADYYVLPANVIENAQLVAAAGSASAAKKGAQRDGVTAGRVAVILVDSVEFRTVSSVTSIDAT